MAMRLTINVEKIRHFIDTRADMAKVIPEVMDKVAEAAFVYNERLVPRKSGELQNSFKVQVEQRTLRCGWSAPHAVHVDKGTEASPGRYVPAIGKRLVSTALSPRRQVYKATIARGYKPREARAALTTRITEVPGKTILVAKSLTRGVANIEALGIYTERTRDIEIAAGTRFKPVVTRHELVHAVQHRAGEMEGPRAKFVEERADYLTALASKQRKNIGKHPGIRKQEFSKKMADALRSEMEEITRETIRRRWHK